ncbi:MAG: hypothetical protein AAGE52_38905 [Myxococcota bacterium]
MALGISARADASCIDDALATLDEAVVLSRDRTFLLTDDVTTGTLVLEEPRCVTVLATATNERATVNAVLRTETGIDLSRDTSATRHAEVRFCGAAGLSLHWTLRTDAPTEVDYVALAGAPSPLPDWGRSLGACFSSTPGVRGTEPDVGRPPAGPTLEGRATFFAESAEAAGYEEWESVALAIRETGNHAFNLEGGTCYRFWAGAEVGAVNLVLVAPDGAERIADRRRAVDAAVGYCPEVSGSFTLIVHDEGGTTEARVRSWRQRVDPPSDLRGPPARAWAESEARNGPLEVLARFHLATGEALSVTREGEGCRTVVAIPNEDAWRSRLELQLIREDGSLAASARRVAGVARLQYCGGAHRLRVRMLRGRGHLIVAEAAQ